jgi:NAD(P)H-hydrate epimerase
MAPEYMTVGLPEDAEGQITEDALERVLALSTDVIAVGPGLGQGPRVSAFVHGLLEQTGVPIVLDADALNAFAANPGALQGRDGLDVIITPHPGEMARLAGMTTEQVQEDRLKVARTFAASHNVHVVLKGHRTLVASPEGAVAVNLTGNPGMATGGTGDVLTGVIAGWFGQMLDAEGACKLGVYLHGHAGDLADADEGETALTASDVLHHLGDAVLELSAERTSAGSAGGEE